jgi:5-methylcytosine-specific restriction protein B
MIEGDTSLGRQFRIGHSFVIPININELKDHRDWFRQVVETQIGPLLEEYWFDDLDKAEKTKDTLLEGF